MPHQDLSLDSCSGNPGQVGIVPLGKSERADTKCHLSKVCVHRGCVKSLWAHFHPCPR